MYSICFLVNPVPTTNTGRPLHNIRLNQQVWFQTLKYNHLFPSYSVDQIISTEIPNLCKDTLKHFFYSYIILYLHSQLRNRWLQEKFKKHYYRSDLLVWEGCHLPLCNPLLTCFTPRPVCSLAPPWNSNSCDPSHPTICQFLVVQQTTRQPNPLKINCLLNGKCDLPFKLTNISNLCNFRHQHSYRSIYSLYQCLRMDRLETACLPHTL